MVRTGSGQAGQRQLWLKQNEPQSSSTDYGTVGLTNAMLKCGCTGAPERLPFAHRETRHSPGQGKGSGGGPNTFAIHLLIFRSTSLSSSWARTAAARWVNCALNDSLRLLSCCHQHVSGGHPPASKRRRFHWADLCTATGNVEPWSSKLYFIVNDTCVFVCERE